MDMQFEHLDWVEKLTGDYHVKGVIVAPNIVPGHPQNRDKLVSVVEIFTNGSNWESGPRPNSFLHIFSNRMLMSLDRKYVLPYQIGESQYNFAILQQVKATTSGYTLEGHVIAMFHTLARNMRYVVEHPASRGSFMHIYSGLNLQRLG